MPPPNVRDVARRAGVSVGTVSNVINNPHKVSTGVVARVTSAMTDLGYVRNDAARQLRAGTSTTIGLVVLDVRNPFFTDLARGAADAAAQAGLMVTLCETGDDTEREDDYLTLLEQQRVRGVLISPIGDISERLKALQSRGTPVVLVDRDGSDSGINSVAVDDVAGGYAAMRHLLDRGPQKICLVAPTTSRLRQVDDRLRGARNAIDEVAGASFTIVESGGLTTSEGRLAGRRIAAMSSKPDAVFAVNDLLAIGILQALVVDSGLSVPEDVALIGYDDIDFVESSVVPLSSVRQPAADIGRTAVETLLGAKDGLVDEARNVTFLPQLVVRDSTRM